MAQVPWGWPESRSVRSQKSPGQADLRPRKLRVLDPGNDRQINISRREDSPGPPYVEVPDAQTSVALDLAQHQRRDQVSRDDEKQAHTGGRVDVCQLGAESCGPGEVPQQDKQNR